MSESTLNENEKPRRGGRQASEEELGWLNGNSQAEAIVGEDRWVGESEHDFLWC